ncbi:winged helix-turn-helix domain-containing protein [Streptomyces sp. 549]|uniref:winged helix-turn-helix domain-containing protein n=1 Tax=Streptomyces sp. 549 TaxID=3049076 RepID=UPI0024C2AEA7|nr:winged helix-turn-helix domain-containing protein [Streptomyces sp. 549]MDK1473277.1 winged helix-turn-helix domain-containing protein [Streptomyces sp. 549]
MSLAANDPRPKPVQVADVLRRDITEGTYRDGRLPPTRELARMLGVAGQTVRDGLSILVDEGLIFSASNRGYFVTAASAAPGPKQDTTEEIKEIRSQIQALTQRVAALEGRATSDGA